MNDVEKTVRARLFELQDIEYKNFQSKLMPTVDPDVIIGIRIPDLRKLARELIKDGTDEKFIKILPHKYYEENNLHAFFIEQIKDFDALISALDVFLPYVNNWATCDLLSPKIFGKHKSELLVKIKEWISSGKTYTIRFGMKTLMSFYLDDDFDEMYYELVTGVVSDEYYIRMMQAWFFATALAKQYDSAVKVLQSKKLDVWTHNKTIRKAIESYRVSNEQKEYLRTLKIK